MARATLTAAYPNRNGEATVTPVANVVVDGQQIDAAEVDGLVLIVSNASGGSGTVTIRASTAEIAWHKGFGDFVVTVGNGVTKAIGPLTLARFKNADGRIYIDTSVVMSIYGVKIP